jgi:hypothetical protein
VIVVTGGRYTNTHDPATAPSSPQYLQKANTFLCVHMYAFVNCVLCKGIIYISLQLCKMTDASASHTNVKKNIANKLYQLIKRELCISASSPHMVGPDRPQQSHLGDRRNMKLSQWRYSGVTVLLQRDYEGVTLVLQWCYSGVSVVNSGEQW